MVEGWRRERARRASGRAEEGEEVRREEASARRRVGEGEGLDFRGRGGLGAWRMVDDLEVGRRVGFVFAIG